MNIKVHLHEICIIRATEASPGFLAIWETKLDFFPSLFLSVSILPCISLGFNLEEAIFGTCDFALDFADSVVQQRRREMYETQTPL